MITLMRNTLGPFDATPLTWRPCRLGDGRWTADIVCGQGHAGLIDEHTIHPDGRVEPSVVCTQECDFHEYVQLEGWAEVIG